MPVRMTLQTLAVLAVLVNRPAVEHYGLELAKEAGYPTGTIYPILARLENAGWVVSEWEDIDPRTEGRRRRRYYRLSPYGAAAAREALGRAAALVGPTANAGAGPRVAGAPA